MDRRQAIQAGVISSGAMLLSSNLVAENFEPLGKVPESQSYLHGELNFTSHKIIENEVADAMSGTEDWGSLGRGIHVREFNVPSNTHLILGHVQEAGNYGHATYQTLGIAINRNVWRCRVIWKMDWTQSSELNTHFHWVKFS